MCGIFGYIQPSDQINSDQLIDACLKGLKSMEYRGYDSSGIAGICDGAIQTIKRTGKVRHLEQSLLVQPYTFTTAIAHTRWATHGAPTETNAHPHLDQHNTLAIVHNGIIENYQSLRESLISQGIIFQSDTDTEIIAALIATHYKGSLIDAVYATTVHLKGSFAIAVIHKNHPNEIIATTYESPLVIGKNTATNELYLSSDSYALSNKSLHITYLDNFETAVLKNGTCTIFNGRKECISKKASLLPVEPFTTGKGDYAHYMLKEIFEQPHTISRYLNTHIVKDSIVFPNFSLSPDQLSTFSNIIIIGCGTSLHAAHIGAMMFQDQLHIPTQSVIASEFRYGSLSHLSDTLVIAISQSGETADTIAAMRAAQQQGATTLAICNVSHSTLVRDANATLYLHAGPEISVCSTKAFTHQLSTLSMLLLYMHSIGYKTIKEYPLLIEAIQKIPQQITNILNQDELIRNYAKQYAHYEHFFFIGRRYMYPTSLEAALKLKEISYINANGYPAGEIKHGPMALISEKCATVGLCGNLQTLDKTISNLMEVKARSGPLLLFAPEGTKSVKSISTDIIWIPNTPDIFSPILYGVASQLLAYHIACIKGSDIDQPRNLAKSVTVE